MNDDHPRQAHRTRRITRFGTTLLSLLLITTGWVEAARLKPPSEAIKEQQNVVMVAEVLELRSDGGLSLERIEPLHGDSEVRIEVRLIDPGPEPLAVGDRRIFGYSDLQRSIRHRNAFERDPDGARVIEVPSIGAAILEDSAPMRRLTTDPPDDRPLEDAQILASILEQVQRPHIQSRRFVLSELVLRPQLLDRLDAEGFGILRETLASGALEPMANDYLIRALLPMATDERVRPWLRSGCRQVLETHPAELDLLSFVPSLAKVAAVALGKVGEPGDIELLAKYLHSNNPAVARESWRSILELNPAAAPGVARKALTAGGLRPEMQATLERSVAETSIGQESDGPRR